MIEKFKEILHRCYRCGNCKAPQHDPAFLCPAYNRVRMESYSPGGRLWLLRGFLNGDLEMTGALSSIFYSCTMCMNCSLSCSFEFAADLVEMMIAANRCTVRSDPPVIPSPVQRYFESVYAYGNAWKKSPKKRGDWCRDLNVPIYGQTHEYLLYIGDFCSYIPRNIKVARAVTRLLQMAGISFGILGKSEMCDGNDARNMGEQELFEHLAQKNIQLFKQKKVKKILTLSPHAYNVFKNEYPKLNGHFDILHHTHLLDRILQEGRVRLSTPLEKRVTYHDPCFLGKWNHEYETPRQILKMLPGTSFVEMDNIKEQSFCCGGGGGNVFTDILGGGENAPAALRLNAARAKDADILAVACPVCLTMLEDALETSGGGLNVFDVSELVLMGI